MDGARHFIAYHLTQGTRVGNAFDDLANTFQQSLCGGGLLARHVPRKAASAAHPHLGVSGGP